MSGYVQDASLEFVPALWLRGTPDFTLLALPAGQTGRIATAITARHRAAGYAFGGACLTWDASGQVTDIGRPAHASGCMPMGMNAEGRDRGDRRVARIRLAQRPLQGSRIVGR